MKYQEDRQLHLQESGEMYLETIYILTAGGKFARSVDVCEYMGYSKPSVSRAVGLLKNGGFLTMDADGFLHQTAAEDACRMEHVISDKSFEAIKEHLGEHERQGLIPEDSK